MVSMMRRWAGAPRGSAAAACGSTTDRTSMLHCPRPAPSGHYAIARLVGSAAGEFHAVLLDKCLQ